MVPDRIKKQFGGNVPEYLIKLFADKENFLREQREKNERISAEYHRVQLEKRKAYDRLKQPPTDVVMNGFRLHWQPPITSLQRQPIGYQVEEQTPDGPWTKHGNMVIFPATSSPLFWGLAAKVETLYGDEALGEHYYSETVTASRPLDVKPVNGVKPKVLTDQEKQCIRETQITLAMASYAGRYTRIRNVPVLSDLRDHARMPDITRKERNHYWKLHHQHRGK